MKQDTLEGRAKTKNGVKRLCFSVVCILLEAAFIIAMLTKLNQYAEIVNLMTRLLAGVLVLKLYASDQTSSMKMPWVILILVSISYTHLKTSEQMSNPLDEDRLIVNIKTGYDVKQVFIHYGDPYEAGILGGNEKLTGKREEIIYKKRLPHQIWWTTTLFPEYKRCKYYFELRTEQEVWYYFCLLYTSRAEVIKRVYGKPVKFNNFDYALTKYIVKKTLSE